MRETITPSWYPLVVTFILCLFPVTSRALPPVPADSTGAGVQWFPQRELFPRRVADGQSPVTSISKDLDSKRIIGSIGGLQRLLEASVAGLPVQLGVAATVYGDFLRKPDVLDVVTVDFFVDLPVDLRLTDWLALRTGWGHYSAHLADDGVESLGLHSINYAKDYVPLAAAVKIPPLGGFLYGGFRFDYYSIPEKNCHWVLQFGGEFGNIPLGEYVDLYGAVDIKLRQEVSWATTQSYQLGVRALRDGPRDIRFAYTYRTGAEERGQFYTLHTHVSLVGLFLDF